MLLVLYLACVFGAGGICVAAAIVWSVAALKMLLRSTDVY